MKSKIINGPIWLILLLTVMVTGCAGSRTTLSKDSLDPVNSLYIAAWYATYDSERGLNSFSDHIQLFNEINPVWYNLNPAYFSNGAPPFISDLRNQAAILSLARTNQIKILPTIQNFGTTNFDPTVISTIINNPVTRTQHVAELVNLVLNENYDGIDIDYENLTFTDRQVFGAFIAELGAALHQHQKLLSVTVYSKTAESATWAGPGAQDWATLAGSADFIKVMVYDYHWISFHAGPISPIDWLQDILQFAGSIQALKGKLIVGLPFYGLDWGTGNPAKEVMYADTMNILAKNTPSNYNRDSIKHANSFCSMYWLNVELHFDYSKNGIIHTVYLQDAEAIRQRLVLINQYRDLVKGVTFWHLGGEDPKIWQELGNYK